MQNQSWMFNAQVMQNLHYALEVAERAEKVVLEVTYCVCARQSDQLLSRKALGLKVESESLS